MQKRTLLISLICVLIVVGCVQDDVVPTEETAVSHYTTLIQQAPDSPWSWLAWARLAPVENN
jgi:hypothetical protein